VNAALKERAVRTVLMAGWLIIPAWSLAQVPPQTRPDQVQPTTATLTPAKEVDPSPATADRRVLDTSTQCANWKVEYQKQCAVPPRDVPEFVANRLAATCGAAAKALVEACPTVVSPMSPGTCSSSDASASCGIRALQSKTMIADYLMRSLADAGRCHYERDECVNMIPLRQRFPTPQ
jgi:hypothetical protein